MGGQATILYRRERKDMPAIDEEIQAAEDEGVRFVYLAAPHRIIGGPDGSVKAIEIVKTRLGEYDKSGRRRPIPTDEVQRFDCDSVILAVGETFDRISAAPPASNSRRKAPSSIASPMKPAVPDSMPAATSSPALPTCRTP
jgi:NADPH-dependent glutamate synthase beta subunit-like oxidoreductase